MDSYGWVYDASKSEIKYACDESYGGINIPDDLLLKCPTLSQDGYIFTSDYSVFSFRNESPLNLPELMPLKEPFFAFGQPPGYGINNYNFVIYYADQDRVFIFDIPYGGVYMDNESGKEKINEAFQKLTEFISDSLTSTDEYKFGLFYKYHLGGFALFKVDRKTFEFSDMQKK